MAAITLKGNPIHTAGDLPATGSAAPAFTAVADDLSTTSLSDLAGKTVVLNIFPSIDTGVCAASVKAFNEKAAGLDNVVVWCLSHDLPFALKRFCGAEGIENVTVGSAFRDAALGKDYGLVMTDGPLEGLLARAVVVVAPDGTIAHTELVPEIAQEPNYDAALGAVQA